MTDFYQADVWVDREGNEIPIDSIDARYARNILRWIRRRSVILHDVASLEAVFYAGTARGDMASYYAEAEADTLIDMNPVRYVNSLPLVDAIRRQRVRMRAS